MTDAHDMPGGMFESLFESVPQLLCVIDADRRMVRVNAHWQSMLGYGAAEIEGTPVLDLAHPDDVDQCSAAIDRAMSGEPVHGFVTRSRAKDGTYHVTEWEASSPDGVLLFAAARDVTEQTELAGQLEDQRAVLDETEAAANIGTWRVDLATARGEMSDTMYRILGLEPGDPPERIGGIVETAVHPDDRAALRSAMAIVREGGGPVPIDCRIVRPDGSLRWVHAGARLHLGPDGVTLTLDGFAQDITERKEAELALAASEAMLRESQQVARVGHYVFDVPGDHWDGSEVLYEIFGISPEYVRDFDGWVNLCHADDLEPMRSYVTDEVLGARAAFDRQYRIVRPSDGAVRWMYGHGRLDLDADGRPVSLFGVIQDITELKRVEERLTQERDRLTAIMETSRVGIVFVGLDRRITLANRRAEEVMGLSRADITSRAYDAPDWRSATLTGEPLPAEEYAVARVIATLAPVRDVRQAIEWPDGRRVLISTNAAPLLDEAGRLSGVVAVFDDITEAVRADEEIRRLNEDLEGRVHERTTEVEAAMRSLADVNLKLEEASAAKSRLLANMSHELRTPLNSVIGFSTILLQGMAGPLNEEQQRQLEMIKRGGKSLLALVDDILDLTRVESGVTQLELSDFVVDDVMSHLVESVRPLAEEKALDLRVSAECPGQVMHSDQGKIGQILLNLLSNAVKFTDEGSVTCECLPQGDDVVFRVTDTGIGIPAEEIPLIMEDFHQVDRITDGMKPRGTGLGLAISWRLARMLGGSLTAESVLGQGSTFTLRVPTKLMRRATDGIEGHA
jgi:PAS domain S-box-containing protein